MTNRSQRTLLSGGTLVTMNGGLEWGRGDVFIDGDRIAGLGDKPQGRKRIDETIDCSDCLVLPGFIQPHIHLCQTLFRGEADNLQLLEWLKERIWPFEAAHTYESLYASAMLGGAELLRSGTTAILDMGTVHHTSAIFEAAEILGLRATIGKAMMDTGEGVPAGLLETTVESIEESIGLAETWHGQANGRLRYAFAPRFVLSCSEQLMVRVVDEARKRGLGMHTHASENRAEMRAVQEICGMNNIAYLDSLGMSGSDTVLAHCVHVSDLEYDILENSGTHVAHCPSSNYKLSSGLARVPEMLNRGINVCLASDGAPCSNGLDQFTEMRLAALIQKPRLGPTAMPAERVVEMATIRGARALGLENEIGSLEEGKKADIVIVKLNSLHVAPTSNPYSALVYACQASDVRDVFVDGESRVRKGKLVGIQARSIISAARKHSAALLERALSAGLSD